MQRTPLMCQAMANQMINDHDAVAGNLLPGSIQALRHIKTVACSNELSITIIRAQVQILLV